MDAKSLIKHGVAVVAKQTPLAPLVELTQAIDDQRAKEALSAIARAHESDIHNLRATSDIVQQTIAKIQALFQGKGNDEVLRDLVSIQKSGNASALLLPEILFDDTIRADFLLNLQHAGSDARIIELPQAHELKLIRPDLVHLIVNDTRGQLVLCQAPIGFVNMTLGRQRDRFIKKRGNHTLDRTPLKDFDFVYDSNGIPQTRIFTPNNKPPVPEIKSRKGAEIQWLRLLKMEKASMIFCIISLTLFGVMACIVRSMRETEAKKEKELEDLVQKKESANHARDIIGGRLDLDHLRYFDIDDELAKYIFDNKPSVIHLNGVKEMHVRGAQLLRMGSMGLKPNGFSILFLNGVNEITENAAKELGDSNFNVIDLNSLKSISAKAMKNLAGLKHPDRILNLNGLQDFPKENTEELYGMKLDTLSLNGIKKIDRSTLEKIKAMLVTTLKLNGLESLEPEDVQALIETFGHIPTIHLNGLKTITPRAVNMLMQLGVKDLYLDGLTKLDENTTFLLAKAIDGNISLNGIKEIDYSIVILLSETKAKRVFLRGLEKFVGDAYHKFYKITNPPIVHSPKLKRVADGLFTREWENNIEE